MLQSHNEKESWDRLWSRSAGGSVVTVGTNRPEVCNAVNQETARRLHEELKASDSDPDLGGCLVWESFSGFGGLELALLADVSVVEESAVMGVFCHRFALQTARQGAEQISSCPQMCLQDDRPSAIYSCYNAPSFTQAMQYETNHGVPVVQQYLSPVQPRSLLEQEEEENSPRKLFGGAS